MTTATTPSEILDLQQSYANTAVAQADTIISRLSDLASSTYFFVASNASIPEMDFGFDKSSVIEQKLISYFPSALTVSDISVDRPAFTPGTVDTTILDGIVVKDFDKEAPSMAIPEAPDATLPISPTAPTVTDPTIPEAPVVVLPDVPVISAISLPEAPSIELPVFTSELPIDDLVVPTNNFSFYEVEYQSALLDELKAKLLDNMVNGGYGIEPLDEAALWDRARGRELENALAQTEDLIAQAASRGFPLPPGDMNVVLQRAQQEVQDKLSDVSRDIMLKRADLYVQNRQFTIQQTKALEDTLIGYHSAVMERALNAAKATLEAAISIFNVQVARYNARLDAYKTEASVFEARLRAALAKLEIFKSQMEGKRLEVEIQRNQVEVYNAQLSGVNAVINLYKTQMEAAQVRAGIERLRIDAFRSLVDAYGAQIQAKVAEFNMYDARIKGEMAKLQAYEAEVRAYTASVQGAEAKAQVLLGKLKGQIDVANQKLEAYRTDMSRYKTDIDAQVSTINSKVAVYDGQVRAGVAKAGATEAAIKLEISEKDLELKRNVEAANVAIAEAKLMLEAALGSAQARVHAGQASAAYYQSLVGSALHSINALSTLSQTL